MNGALANTALVIIGAGPAGLAPLFAAANAGCLDEVLSRGVVLLEQGTTPGAGSLREQAIRSDSYAATFTEIVLNSQEASLRALRTHPATQALLSLGNTAAPLGLVAQFLDVVSATLIELIRNSAHGCVVTGVQVLSVRSESSCWRTEYRHLASDLHVTVLSHSVLVATGGHQPVSRLYSEEVAGQRLLPAFKSKLMQSGEVLAHGGIDRVADRLRNHERPKVAILGGSTSAVAVATHLLQELGEMFSAPASLTLMHRRPLSLFFDSVGQALQEGYTQFRTTDICPLSGRVFRLGGLRLDSKALLMNVLGLKGSTRDERLELLPLELANNAKAREALQQVDLIIVAFGYQPRLITVLDECGTDVPLHVPHADAWAVVDKQSRLLTRAGNFLPGVFAMGLSSGPPASSERGGEQGFRGQVNSLWLWQHALGMNVIRGVLERSNSLTGTSTEPRNDTSTPLYSVQQPAKATAASVAA